MFKKGLLVALLLIFSFTLAFAEEFTITLFDSYGDGWNGGVADVTVAGVLVLDDITAPDDGGWGNGGIPHPFTFEVNDGDEVVVDYTPDGYPGENSYTITNNIGVEIYASPAPPLASYSFTAVVGSTDMGTISGTVTDGTDPVEGAVITFATYTATSAADGTYSIADIYVGNYDAVCNADGFFQGHQNFDVTVGANTVVDFALNVLTGDTTDDAIDVVLVDNAFTFAGTNVQYANDYPFGNGNDLVFHLILDSDAIVDADLLGSDYDTKLAVYNDSEVPGEDNELYGNDDYTAPERHVTVDEKRSTRDRALQSAIFDMELPAGGYWILVDSYAETSLGNYVLQIAVEGQTTTAPAVFFSEYIEGSSNNKALEIYNGSDEEIALADFRINQSNNGGDWQYIHTFPADAMLASGDVWVIITDQVDPELYAAADADEVLSYPSVVHFNGNDARALEYSADGETWEIIDVIGVPTEDIYWAVAGVDPGTQNHTIVRKDEVMVGNTDWAASAGTNTDDSEWMVMDEDTFTYLGWHIDQPMTPAYISGTITIDGFGDLTTATVAAGDSMTYANADGTYMLEVLPGTYDVTASMAGYNPDTVTDVVATAGSTTENVDFALTVIEEALWPPVNLNFALDQDDVVLSWTAPTQYGWNTYYDGPASLTWAGPERAILFDVTDFGFSYPMELSQISHAFYEHSAYPWGDDTTFKFVIYGADGSTVIYESDTITALTQWAFTELTFDTPITVTENFYVAVVPTGDSGFPSSLFDSDDSNLHGYVGSAGEWGEPYADFATMVYITGDDEPTALTYSPNAKVSDNANIRRASRRENSVAVEEEMNETTRDLVYFNIYRDGVQINDVPVTSTTYTDMDLAAGSYTYYATAVWNYGESGASNEVTATLAFGDLTGTVTVLDEDTPIEGAAVSAGGYGATTDIDGNYTIAGMLVGSYEVSCSAAGYQAADPVTADITDGGTTTVDFELEPVVGDLFFFDDFESGTDNWVLEDTWGLTEEGANSPTHSLTESPDANYGANLNIAATLATPWDLSTVFGATLSFWYQSDIETAFDYMYLEITSDGENWLNLATYDEEDGAWQQEEISISGFVGPGYETVSIRFRFESDGGYETVGMLIDDIQVTTSSVDMDPPFIIHAGPEFYEGTDEDYQFTAELIDPSGVASAQVVYTCDGGDEASTDATQGEGNTWNFTIPAQPAGCEVEYKIVATDASDDANTGELDSFVYIAGHHFIYDNGIVDFYTVFNEGMSAAVRVDNPAGTIVDLAFALIRNYTDQSGQDNNNFMFHVWEDDNGLPGADMITPFEVVPEATYENTSPMTRVDLRDYAAELSGIQTNFFFGFAVDTGDPNAKVHCTITQPGNWLQSFFLADGVWGQAADTDYHFRAVAALQQTAFATIEGNVSYDGNNIEGATVTAGTFTTTTDADGNYTLYVNPGDYTLTIEAEDYNTFTEAVSVADGDVITVNAVLTPALWPPSNLETNVNGYNVVLQWEDPVPPSGGETVELIYDNDVSTGAYSYVGYSMGTQMSPDEPCQIMTLKFHTSDGTDFNAEVWGWDGAPTEDLLFQENVAAATDDWVMVDVADENLMMDGDFVVTFGSLNDVTFLSYDGGLDNGRSWDHADAGGWSSWSEAYLVRAVVMYGDGRIAEISAAPKPITQSARRSAVPGEKVSIDVPDHVVTRNTRSLEQFKIYKNDALLTTLPATTHFYVDTNVTEINPTYYVTAVYVDPDGESGPSNEVLVYVDAPYSAVPAVTELQSNYPNPFNPATRINFSLKEGGNVNIEVYNVKGQKVKTLLNQYMEASRHELIWNGTDDNNNPVASGIYFYRMETKDYTKTRKMMMLK